MTTTNPTEQMQNALEDNQPAWATAAEIHDNIYTSESGLGFTYQLKVGQVEWGTNYNPETAESDEPTGWFVRHEDLTLDDMRSLAADLLELVARVERAELVQRLLAALKRDSDTCLSADGTEQAFRDGIAALRGLGVTGDELEHHIEYALKRY